LRRVLDFEDLEAIERLGRSVYMKSRFMYISICYDLHTHLDVKSACPFDQSGLGLGYRHFTEKKLFKQLHMCTWHGASV
jgi:hypothetical protein